MILKKLLATLTLVLLCFGIYAQVKDSTLDFSTPKVYEIGGITVSGIKHFDETVLINVSGLTVGDKIEIPGEPIRHAIQKLWDQNFFENVKISYTSVVGDKIFLDIELVERPRLSNFVFNGIDCLYFHTQSIYCSSICDIERCPGWGSNHNKKLEISRNRNSSSLLSRNYK